MEDEKMSLRHKIITGIVATVSVAGLISLATLSEIHNNREKQRYQQKMEQEYPEFQQEKILTCSAEEYCKSNQKSLEDYSFVGVDGSVDTTYRKFRFSCRVPRDAEVVVSTRYSCLPYWIDGIKYEHGIAIGTALIPRNLEGKIK